MDKKNTLIIAEVVFGMAITLLIVDKATSNPLIECQNYVENWRITELNKIKKTFDENIENNKDRIQEYYNEPCRGFGGDTSSCVTYRQAIANRANADTSIIEGKYSNKLKACSSKN